MMQIAALAFIIQPVCNQLDFTHKKYCGNHDIVKIQYFL